MSTRIPAAARIRARLADYAALVKPRITALVVLTTYVGYHLGAAEPAGWSYVLHLLLGTGLVCGGTSTLNQVWERDRDARMQRTRRRPLPAARIGVAEALVFGAALSVVGLAELALFVNRLAAAVAAFTLATYIFVYTPLKPRTWLCTAVGAVPGALPPVIGWTGARGELDAGGWTLFAILFAWQLPHFYALAWMYRDDYARGGFRVLSVIDPEGRGTRREILAWSAALLPLSLGPVALHLAGPVYLAGALALGVAFLAFAVQMALGRTAPHALRLFLASIVYLPALFGLLVLDKVGP